MCALLPEFQTFLLSKALNLFLPYQSNALETLLGNVSKSGIHCLEFVPNCWKEESICLSISRKGVLHVGLLTCVLMLLNLFAANELFIWVMVYCSDFCEDDDNNYNVNNNHN